MNKILVPRLRFRGFNDEWNNKKLSSLSSIHARIGWQNLRTSEFLNNGDYLLITGTNFNNGKINFDKCYYVKKERYDQDENIKVKNGNILITKDGTLGKVAIVKGLNIPATLNAGVFNLNVNSKLIDNNYLFQFLKAPFLMKYVKQHSTGGTISHLNQSVLVNFPIQMPSLIEQQRISLFFAKLDRMIELQFKKINHLKQLKKGYLQKMFTQKGKNVPKLRFDGFRDEWNKIPFNDIFQERKTKKIPSSDFPLMAFVKDVGIVPKGDKYDRSALVTQSNKKYKITKLNDFIYSSNNFDTGSMGINKTGNAVISPVYSIFQITDDFNNYFINMISEKSNFKHNMKRYRQGVMYGQLRINEKDFLRIRMFIPTLLEQNKIGTFFKHLDKLIERQNNKIHQLKRLKKAYLQKMFI